MSRIHLIKRNLVISAVAALSLSTCVNAETPSAEEMWKIIQEQQQVINQLQQQLSNTEEKVNVAEQKVEETRQTVEAAADAMETAQASSGAMWADKLSIGGYGELHYNSQEGNDEVDFHRFVAYLGYEFTDNVRFFSEIELEHSLAGEGKPGEVELEQAWIEMDLNQSHRVRAGLDILPVGIINYTHEPDTFYGVERPNVESRIIPSTWWEAGIGLIGELAPGWNYDVILHSGLAAGTDIRGGRQKVAEANADHPAFTTRLRYTAIPGLEVGGSFQYQADITADAASGSNEATLLEGHVDYKHSSGLGLRALYARWDLDQELVAGTGDDEQWGYYIEPAYRFALAAVPGDLGVFARYSELEYGRNAILNEETIYRVGFNYWPVDQVAFKFDWTTIDDEVTNNSADSLNLGMGFSF